jgi:hypothetical protein
MNERWVAVQHEVRNPKGRQFRLSTSCPCRQEIADASLWHVKSLYDAGFVCCRKKLRKFTGGQSSPLSSLTAALPA